MKKNEGALSLYAAVNINTVSYLKKYHFKLNNDKFKIWVENRTELILQGETTYSTSVVLCEVIEYKASRYMPHIVG